MTLAELKALAERAMPVYEHPSTRITVKTKCPGASGVSYPLAANPQTVLALIERVEGLSKTLKEIEGCGTILGIDGARYPVGFFAQQALTQYGADVDLK